MDRTTTAMQKHILASIIGTSLMMYSCYEPGNERYSEEGSAPDENGETQVLGEENSIVKEVDFALQARNVYWRIRPLDGEGIDDVTNRLLRVAEKHYGPYSFLTLLEEENGERLQLKCPLGELRETYGPEFILTLRERWVTKF